MLIHILIGMMIGAPIGLMVSSFLFISKEPEPISKEELARNGMIIKEDYVKVVRCKDCKHWIKCSVIGHIHYLCTKFNKDTPNSGYCYLAERKEE